jgi:hypothetical protein
MGSVKRGEYIYIAYDPKDGLPIAVADTVADLAAMVGCHTRTISRGLCKGSRLFGKVKNEVDHEQ